ncbi:hypothetical protein [Pantoea endophytica]|uniref:hypothetical protein n=1 Tax=Pantoea endophytica TaxID=92488 RepID=UPI001AE3FD2E|nr:hypothetical protein [Pantoea endophytica]
MKHSLSQPPRIDAGLFFLRLTGCLLLTIFTTLALTGPGRWRVFGGVTEVVHGAG